MGTASGSDYVFLTQYGFFQCYSGQHRSDLIAVAKLSYADMTAANGIPPDPLSLSFSLELDLKGALAFFAFVVDVCRAIKFQNPQDSFWPDWFAGPVSRYW